MDRVCVCGCVKEGRAESVTSRKVLLVSLGFWGVSTVFSFYS